MVDTQWGRWWGRPGAVAIHPRWLHRSLPTRRADRQETADGQSTDTTTEAAGDARVASDSTVASGSADRRPEGSESPDDGSAAASESPEDAESASEPAEGTSDRSREPTRRALTERLRRAEAAVDRAERAREEHGYAAAIAAYEEALELFRSFRELAASIPNTKHLVVRETRGDAIADRIAAVERALSTVRSKREPFDRLDAILTDVADQQAAARRELDAGAFGTARTIATDALGTLALADRYASAHDLGVADRIEALENPIERVAERGARSAERPGALAVDPPAIVPRAPRLSLDPEEYVPQAVIGTSGRSIVERAGVAVTDRDRRVAVKRFRAAAPEVAAVEAWIDVADHDHVAGVVDYGTDPELWIAIEYLDGGRIDERAGRLPTDQALWTAAAIADAVWHAHRQDLLHGALHPGNVGFRRVEDAWDVPRVTDWAVASATRADAPTPFEQPPTAAPEQLAGDPVDERTDIFQLGCLLYQLFVGERPFGAGEQRAVTADGIATPPVPPSERVAVPEALDRIVLRALEPDPDDRYARALFLRDDLRECFRAY